ncbi:MAG TPA: hypothetical protein VG755_26035 [Nannocystaceae bacterium]|nr:hypothetical protein [Nannocystaceae bacterium]
MASCRIPLVLVGLACACNSGSSSNGSGSSSSGGSTGGSGSTTVATSGSETAEPMAIDVEALGNACVSLRSGDTMLVRNGDAFAFGEGTPAKLHLQAADLGVYLLYDEERGYVVAEDGPLVRQTSLQSDVLLIDDTYISGAEWIFEPAPDDPGHAVRLHNRRNDRWLGIDGLVDEGGALSITLEDAEGCVEHPELTLDASGTVTRTTFEDGTLYGIVDTHSHIMSNWGFGGGGIFHGHAFHRLGIEHALPDCSIYHGEMGRKDFFGYSFDNAGADGADLTSLVPDLLAGELAVDNHITDGYPEFTEWPNGPTRSTHQMQYYRWIERAYLAGLRLVVQHATTNSIICHMTAGQGIQQVRYSCEDMAAVDRIIDETYALERYIDAQSGGAGLGWFRIVQTPAQAREVIASGKLAVILGIETADLFQCRLVPREGGPVCDEEWVRSQLDAYYERGIRAVFPVHKYDNAFGPGDGDRAFIEVGNFFNTGHWSNFTLDCPPDMPARFDNGDVVFGGLNMPRDEYDSPPPNDLSGFPELPLGTAFPYINSLGEPPLVGAYCQNATLTPIGETLIHEMMLRGMIIEVDHLPQWSYERAFEMLEENDYPAVGSHSGTYNGRIYQLGGVSKTGLGTCRDPAAPGAMTQRLKDRMVEIETNGGYPAEGFGFDLNGFAGAPGPRFETDACAQPQEDPVTYPFRSYADDVEFTAPFVGNRGIDYNTEGFVHIGMLPEMLDDARRDAVDEADLEPLFKSAEGYIRMWERAEERAAALR